MSTSTQIAEERTRRHLVAIPGGRELGATVSSPRWAPIVIRRSVAGDRRALRELAYLDSRRPLAEDMLVAEQGGWIVAAITLDGESVIADPFLPTADAVALLRVRAKQLAREVGRPVA